MTFNYDVGHLIKLVEERPCLWDRSNEFFRNTFIRNETWLEIYHILEDNFDELSKTKKKEVAVKISTKWVNIKDAFLKTLKNKTKVGSKQKRKYHYADQLQFLLKREKKEKTTMSMILDLKKEKEDEDVFTSSDISTDDKVSITFDDQIQPSPLRGHLENSTYDPVTPNMSNDDKFFQSFVPYIKDMTETERIELQMDILSSIKRIKENRCQSYTVRAAVPIQLMMSKRDVS